ncbi:MAG: hypothetical protein ACOCZ5_00375 [bacterium]
MYEKEHNNTFKFSLHQQDVLLGEKVFDADMFNPITRYSIDIRNILPRIITRLQKILSKKNYVTGLTDDFDLFVYNKQMINSYPPHQRQDMKYLPKSITQHIEDKVIKGVECKLGFYINDKPIVERVFYVDGYNPVAKLSLDLIDEIINSTDMIFDEIKKSDRRNMWDDYDLINVRGLTINQIRELTPQKRSELLWKIRRK